MLSRNWHWNVKGQWAQGRFRDGPKPEDIARVIMFLCGDSAKVIDGAAVPVFGNS
jgi:NAD(P)-dependent dehydrogenase (short-subunit alcohol dehydrogenase family)